MKDIISQFQKIPTTCISDAMKGLNNLSPDIKPLKDTYKVAGRAFTVKLPVGENKMLLKAISEANEGNVLVIDAKGNSYRAVAGDFMIAMAKILGIKGFVVDGAIRDIIATKDLNYPVFCKGTTVAASEKNGTGEINVPISCGEISICPGDIIVGDVDGVVVIPQAIEEDILVKSQQKLHKDNLRAEEVLIDKEAVRKYLDHVLL